MVLVLFLAGCSKGTNQNNIDEKPEITASVIEDSKENCRFDNESDCRLIEIKRGEPENGVTNSTQETTNVEETSNNTINLSEEKFILLNCTEGWKCVEKNYRAYQYTNCSWISIEFCVYGCKDDICKPAPICKRNSLKCDNDNVLKCNDDGDGWVLNESCDYKCQNGICIGKNQTIQTNTTNLNNTNTSSNNSTQANICDNNCISITNFHYNAGDDCNNLNNEYVIFKNNCSYSCDLSNWNVSDASSHSYLFPSFTLDSQATFTLYTGNGTDTTTQLYWKSKYTPCPAIWNNNGDTLYLRNASRDMILQYSYP